MTKNELKSEALESMGLAGASMKEGNFQEAKGFAEKAWNYYFELQKQRSEDEDFTDLIYSARGMYNQAKEALEQQQREVKKDGANEEIDYTYYEFTIEDLEDDLELQLSKLKEARENNNDANSEAVYNALYSVLIDQVMLAEKRIKDKRDCWKNIQLVKDFIPGVKEMLKSQHLDKQAHENMLDLSLRAFDCIDNTLCITSPISSVRLKRELEQMIKEIAQGLPGQEQNIEQYEEILNVLDYFISMADNDQLDEVLIENEGIAFDPIELTPEYENILPQADRRGEEVYRMKGEGANVEDFYYGKRLYLGAMGINWTPPKEANSSDE